jgi:hypothetical protein
MTDPKPGDWLDVNGKPARVVEVSDGRLVVDAFLVAGQPPHRHTYNPAIHGPFPPLPPERVPKGGE